MQMHPNLKVLIFISTCDTYRGLLFTVKHLKKLSLAILYTTCIVSIYFLAGK